MIPKSTIGITMQAAITMESISELLADLRSKRHQSITREEAKNGYEKLLKQELSDDVRAGVYRNLAKIAKDENKYERAKDLINSGLQLDSARKETREMLMLSLAELYEFHLGDVNQALKLYISLQEGTSYPNIKAKIALGNARHTDRHHPRDTDWYLEALDLLVEKGDVNLRAQALIGLGNARYTDRRHPR